MEWKLAYAPHAACRDIDLRTAADVERSGFPILSATVPGCIETELMKIGELPDLYFSDNTLLAQKLENLHLWYYTTVDLDDARATVRFGGIDTVADLFVNGAYVRSSENMFVPCDLHGCFVQGKNEIVVHVKPICIEARKIVTPAASRAQPHCYPALVYRKAAHMFGWDIMPRIVSAGLWKPVEILPYRADRIEEVYLSTARADLTHARLSLYYAVGIGGDFAQEYTLTVSGRCGESAFSKTARLYHTCGHIGIELPNPKLWWPKNAGDQNLYDVTVTLAYRGETRDEYSFRAGVRTIRLDRTDTTDRDGNGKFCFEVNGREIFALGTNWVSLDALHCNDEKRLDRALALLDDVGCNMVRCWGGNLYESDRFYDFCDEHGILVWQDFAFACELPPQNERLFAQIKEEAEYQIKRLRNHPALALWAGDNECDDAWAYVGRDPNDNLLTREVLRRAVGEHDYTRSYLPSSPYRSPAATGEPDRMPEKHLWGPRDYFKGDFYKNTFCHFASETGYHGFNSPTSLRRFLKDPETIFRAPGIPTDEYLVHASSMSTDMAEEYSYRIGLAVNQVVTLFGRVEENHADFVRQSQISQAEAVKYFIEKFRIAKPVRSGILWWNLIDGWPQVSDAVVDYYGVKKLAYSFIRRSQNPVCLMFDEPEDGKIRLFGVNDLPDEKSVAYTVTNVTDGKVVLTGTAVLPTDRSVEIASLPIEEGEQKFYLIEWQRDGKTARNHYFTNLLRINYRDYLSALAACGLDEFEGF